MPTGGPPPGAPRGSALTATSPSGAGTGDFSIEAGTEEGALRRSAGSSGAWPQEHYDALRRRAAAGRQGDTALWRDQIIELQTRMLRWYRSLGVAAPRARDARGRAARGLALDDELAAMSEDELRRVWEARFDQDEQMQRWLQGLQGAAGVAAPV